jgi:RES domain
LTLENIINEFDKKVQAYKDTDDSYQVFIKMLLEEYVEKINTMVDLLDGIDPKYHPYINRPNSLKTKLQPLATGLIKTINYYLSKSNVNGNAYNIFTKSIGRIKTDLISGKVDSNTNLYRLCSINSIKTDLPRHRLFHIPFEKRGIASTNRYSLPGYPCLYLANSTYVAWRELLQEKEGDLGMYAIAKFNNILPLRFIEIDSKPFRDRIFYEDRYKYEDLFSYALLFPLIASCSLKVKEINRNNPFKPEYIIPQFLLEYVRKSDFDCIKYRSTRVDDEKVNAWNYAIPPKQPLNIGYCTKLKTIFQMSPVKNFNFSEPLKLYVDKEYKSKSNDAIVEIIIEGYSYKFEKTFFSQVEYIFEGKHPFDKKHPLYSFMHQMEIDF